MRCTRSGFTRLSKQGRKQRTLSPAAAARWGVSVRRSRPAPVADALDPGSNGVPAVLGLTSTGCPWMSDCAAPYSAPAQILRRRRLSHPDCIPPQNPCSSPRGGRLQLQGGEAPELPHSQVAGRSHVDNREDAGRSGTRTWGGVVADWGAR